MWIRDSAVQINVLLPRIRKRPALRRPIEGAIRAQAFYILQVRHAAVWLRVRLCYSAGASIRQETCNCVIDGHGFESNLCLLRLACLQDPYANGYEPEWIAPGELPRCNSSSSSRFELAVMLLAFARAVYISACAPSPPAADSRHTGDRVAGRGGWVGVRNFELDSGAYYLNLLWNWYLTPGLYRPDRLLEEPLIFDAANLLVDIWCAWVLGIGAASGPALQAEQAPGWKAIMHL